MTDQSDIFKIHQGEIFVASQCLWHEHRLRDFMASILTNLGWNAEDEVQRRWHRDYRLAVLCLSDDFLVAGGNRDQNPAVWFPPYTDVITDNHVDFRCDYKVWQLPASYFGIHSYVPCRQHWSPFKDIGLAINRGDKQRRDILLEMTRCSGGVDNLMRDHLVNFNHWVGDDQDQCMVDIGKGWHKNLSSLDYVHLSQTLATMLPLRNHYMPLEQAHISVWLNCVVETYAGDHTHAFSEKIFRALSTPAPWILFGAKASVDYLSQLGFDVLDDVIDHGYDALPAQNKIPHFMQTVFLNLDRVKQRGQYWVRQRCLQAASHNQQMLAAMRQQWPRDFAAWLPQVVDKLA